MSHNLPTEYDDSISSRIRTAVRTLITSREMWPGEIIVEAELAKRLGVSRTPLREALRGLEGRGLLVRKGRLFVIRAIGLSEYLHALRARRLLEGEAAAFSAGNVPARRINIVREAVCALLELSELTREQNLQLDGAVYGLFIEYCGNDVLAQFLRDLRDETSLYEKMSPPILSYAYNRYYINIISAIERKNSRQARLAVRAQLQMLYNLSADLFG